MEKIIGVSPLYDSDRQSYWMVPGYMKMLESAGALPIMLPLSSDEEELKKYVGLCGGFLLTGGQDVSPEFYGARRGEKCGECCVERDRMDSLLLKEAVAEDKPVLGICRGIQLMNAAMGGGLYQDLPTEYKSGVEHHMSPPYDRAAHYVKIVKDTLLYGVFGEEKIGVNSYHHQAVKKLSPAFKASAISEDGLVEGIYMPDRKFIVGVQWHPEFFYEKDIFSRKLVAAFVGSV